jgi:catechol 2,3-dioxygenase-like lactoylglutathione lyase family enzyme
MKIEHLALQMKDPVAAASWYVKHLGFCVWRKQDTPPFAHFLADSSGATVLEIYCNPKVRAPDYARMDPLLLHLAFAVGDVARERTRLLAAGARKEGEVAVTETGDTIAVVRDPWGLAIQLVKRSRPLNS